MRTKKIQIIPAILEQGVNQVVQKLEKIAPYTDWVQLDIADGRFVQNTTWQEPELLKEILESVKTKKIPKIEIHLMTENPEKIIEKWFENGAARLIFHFEAMQDFKKILSFQSKNREIGMALNPETSLETIRLIASQFAEILFLTVNPGAQGRKFLPEVLEKVRQAHKVFPKLVLGVDGGIRPGRASQAVRAGAARLCVGSYIWAAGNPVAALTALRRDIGLR